MTVKTSSSSLGSASSADGGLFCCPFGILYAFSKSFRWPAPRVPVSYGKMQSGEISTSELARINQPTNYLHTVCPGLGVCGSSPEAERERERLNNETPSHYGPMHQRATGIDAQLCVCDWRERTESASERQRFNIRATRRQKYFCRPLKDELYYSNKPLQDTIQRFELILTDTTYCC